MSTYTPYLDLLKKNPLTEGSDTFNITTMLNDNWDKIDTGLATRAIRPNILDNWYFVGGGSQQGGGHFPINQRGSSSYNTDSAYTIDRWVLRAGASVSLASDGLQFSSNGSGYNGFNQPLENKDMYAGVKFKVSVFVKDVTISSGSTFRFGIYSADSAHLHTYAHGYANITGNGLFSATVTVDPTELGNHTYLNVGFYTSSTAVSAKVIAVKVEIGESQTLGHLNNSVWVLNEVPNYQQELAKCQRYFFSADSLGTTYCNYDLGIADSTTTVTQFFKLPVPLRTIPALSYTGKWAVAGGSSMSAKAVTGIAMAGNNAQAGGSTVIVKVTVGSGLTVGESYLLQKQNSASGKLWLSADL